MNNFEVAERLSSYSLKIKKVNFLVKLFDLDEELNGVLVVITSDEFNLEVLIWRFRLCAELVMILQQIFE